MNKHKEQVKIDYMDLPCAKCGKFTADDFDNYENRNGIVITKYHCISCGHIGKRSSLIRKNAKNIENKYNNH